MIRTIGQFTAAALAGLAFAVATTSVAHGAQAPPDQPAMRCLASISGTYVAGIHDLGDDQLTAAYLAAGTCVLIPPGGSTLPAADPMPTGPRPIEGQPLPDDGFEVAGIVLVDVPHETPDPVTVAALTPGVDVAWCNQTDGCTTGIAPLGYVRVLPTVWVAPQEAPTVRAYLRAVHLAERSTQRQSTQSAPVDESLPPPPEPPAAPPPGDGVWSALAQCESGGNWSISTGNGYYGGLQMTPTFWSTYGDGSAPSADQATPDAQIAAASRYVELYGHYGAWPGCARELGLPTR